jgi:protease I
MDKPLLGQKIAILVANGFNETDMMHAQRRLAASGAIMKIISTENGLVNSWVGNGWGHHFPADGHVSTMLAADFDALYVAGGSRSLAKLKENPHCRRIIRGFFDAGKPMMLLGSAVELLAVSERASGCIVTGSPESQAILEEAGATWTVESPCVTDFLATALGNDAENPVFQIFDTFFMKQSDTFKQAA